SLSAVGPLIWTDATLNSANGKDPRPRLPGVDTYLQAAPVVTGDVKVVPTRYPWQQVAVQALSEVVANVLRHRHSRLKTAVVGVVGIFGIVEQAVNRCPAGDVIVGFMCDKATVGWLRRCDRRRPGYRRRIARRD